MYRIPNDCVCTLSHTIYYRSRTAAAIVRGGDIKWLWREGLQLSEKIQQELRRFEGRPWVEMLLA